MIESQINYIMDFIKQVDNRKLRYMDVKPRTQQQYNAVLQNNLKHSVWSSGCHNWYVSENGKNTNNWSDYTYRYNRLTARVNVEHYKQVA